MLARVNWIADAQRSFPMERYRGFDIHIHADKAGYRFTLESEWGVTPAPRFYPTAEAAAEAARTKIQRMLAKLSLAHVVDDFYQSGKIDRDEHRRLNGLG